MSDACKWSLGPNALGRYTCLTHKGGTFELGAKWCEKAKGLWADLERLNRRLAAEELERTRKAVQDAGWSFLGFAGPHYDRWEARRGSVLLSAATGDELVRKVRQAAGLNPGTARQEVLF